MCFSNLIVKEIVSVYTVDRSVGTYTNINRPYSAFCLKTSGSTIYRQDERKYFSDNTHLIYIPKGSAYTYSVKEKGSCIIAEFIFNNEPSGIQSVDASNASVIKNIVSNMQYAWSFKCIGYREMCLSYIYQLLYHAILYKHNSYIPKIHQSRIKSSIQYLHEHFCENNVSVDDIAEQSHISTIYFRRLFTEIYGVPPKKYTIMLRVNRAKELLEINELSIKQIAQSVGFGDIYSFGKAFRKEVRVTPTEYRKQFYAQNAESTPGS